MLSEIHSILLDDFIPHQFKLFSVPLKNKKQNKTGFKIYIHLP